METNDNIKTGVPRDASTDSIWQENIKRLLNDNNSHNPNTIYDVLIIGGGITGLTTALLLQEAGKNCILAEAHSIGYGATGGTTAHINTFIDSYYHSIEKDFGPENAKLVARACQDAVELVEGLVQRYEIDCDFFYKTGYLYAETDKEVEELNNIYESSAKAGVEVHTTDTIPVSVPFIKAIAFNQQAQIHPLKYIYALAIEFIKKGGLILQNTLITSTEKENGFHIATADNITIKTAKIVYATHIPPGINLLHFRCAPYRSYALAAKLSDNNYPADLAYDLQDPYHYFRTYEINGQNYLVVGGSDHKTGQGSPDDAFQSLENYLRKYYKVASIDYKWSAQYYIPADGLPYIGKLPGFDEDVYVATGFNGSGITLGSVAGKIIKDLVLGEKNNYADLFSPGRIKPIAGFSDFVKENSNVVYRFVADRLSIKDIDSLNEIPLDGGALVEYNNEKLAIYKDAAGEIHALNPVCTHAGCIVNWNNIEKSWDCPCHGARYDINGEVLTGPASKKLQKIDVS